jgi:hypothetical protein
MKLINFPEKEIEEIKKRLGESKTIHVIRISSEYGEYKRDEFLKTPWGEKLVVREIISIRDFEHFKKEYIHYPELKDSVNLAEIEQLFTHKKMEIIELRKYQAK